MDVVAVAECLLLPWILFCLLYGVFSFRLHYDQSALCWILVAAALAVVILCGVLAARAALAKVRHNDTHPPSWYIFLFLSMLAAWVLALWLGNLNYWTNLHAYYDYANMNQYVEVNPAKTRGQQLMDAGRVSFADGASLDLRKSMVFQNEETYCVAPISMKGVPLASYDFWAVGVGCCSSGTADFHCGAYADPAASGGLRLLRDDQRAFFRLAVGKAEAVHAIKANHPLFFFWTSDPQAEMESFRDEGRKFYLIGMILHFLWQLLCTSLATVGFSRMDKFGWV